MQKIDHSGVFKTLNVFINIANKFYLIFLSMMPEPLKNTISNAESGMVIFYVDENRCLILFNIY